MDKFERLLNLVALLEARSQPFTAAQIREQLDGYSDSDVAFHRTFERDKADLLEMGVPLVTGKDLEGDVTTYTVRHDASPATDFGFTDRELLALRLAAGMLAVRNTSVEAPTALTGAFRKLGGAPESGSGGAVGEIPLDPALVASFAAVMAGRGVAFRYESSPAVRRVAPQQVLYRGGRWYVRGVDLDLGEGRTFRTDRMSAVLAIPEGAAEAPAAPTGRFRPWEFGHGDPVEARVVLDPTVALLARREDPDLEFTDTGEVRLQVRSPAGLFDWLVTWLDRAELVDPPEMRDAFVGHLRRLASDEAA